MSSNTNSESGIAPIIIKSTRGWLSVNLRELWDYRELLFYLTWRDIKVRYKQTILGVSWAIIQPFFTMVVFSLIFGQFAKVETDNDIAYPIFSFAALVPWTFFANSLSRSSNSLVGGANMIKKVYFPRLVLPIAGVLSSLVDFLLAFVVLVVMMLVYGFAPNVNFLWLPVFLALAMFLALGVGLWLSAMNVQFRDIQYAVPFVVQMWLWLTPVAYSSRMVSESWRPIYDLNPMKMVIDGFRWVLLNTDTGPEPMIIVPVLIIFAVFAGGMFYFRRMEKIFADVV